MEDLTHIELTNLYDLLAQQTNQYMKMLSDGATRDEFNECRESILSLQAEIVTRKNQKAQAQDSPSISSANSELQNQPGA